MRVTFICSLILSMSLGGAVSAQPKLFIAESQYDFGTAPQGSTVVNYFWFKSMGKDTVRIMQIKTGCDCATMLLPKKELSPGDSLLVGFFWETQQKIGSSGKYPYVFVDGIEDPYRMSMQALVIPHPDSAVPLALKPYKAEFSRMSGKSIDSVGFTLTNRGKDKLILKVVSTVPPEYTYSVPDTLAPLGTAAGFVRIAPAVADREFKSSLTIEWTGADNQTGRITLPIRRKLFG